MKEEKEVMVKMGDGLILCVALICVTIFLRGCQDFIATIESGDCQHSHCKPTEH